MTISRSITERFGLVGSDQLTLEEVEQRMLEKSKEFTDAGNRVYLPIAD